MTTSTSGCRRIGRVLVDRWSAHLTNRVRERLKIIRGCAVPGLTLDPHDRPAQWHSEAVGVRPTQVVGMRLDVWGERPEDGCRLGVGVRERGDRGR